MASERAAIVTWLLAPLVMVAATAFAQGPEVRSLSDVTAWARTNLHLTGWTYLDHSAEVVRFISRPAAREGAQHVLIKMRVERFEKDAAREERSVLSDVEIDCEGHRTRILSSIGFANPDLRGPVVFRRNNPDAWRDPAGTVMDIAYDRVCTPPSERPSSTAGRT